MDLKRFNCTYKLTSEKEIEEINTTKIIDNFKDIKTMINLDVIKCYIRWINII